MHLPRCPARRVVRFTETEGFHFRRRPLRHPPSIQHPLGVGSARPRIQCPHKATYSELAATLWRLSKTGGWCSCLWSQHTDIPLHWSFSQLENGRLFSLKRVVHGTCGKEFSSSRRKPSCIYQIHPTSCSLQENTLHHVSTSEHAVHYCRLGLDKDNLSQTVDYYTTPAYVTAYLSTLKMVSGTPRLSFSETAFDMDKAVTIYGRSTTLQPEPKPMTVIRHIFRKKHQASSIGPWPMFGGGATAKAYIMEPQLWKLTGCDSNGSCVENMTPSLL